MESMNVGRTQWHDVWGSQIITSVWVIWPHWWWRMDFTRYCSSQCLSVTYHTPRYRFNVTYLLLLCCCTGSSSLSASCTNIIRIHQRENSWCGTQHWWKQLSYPLHCCQCTSFSSILFGCWELTHLSNTLRRYLIRTQERIKSGLYGASQRMQNGLQILYRTSMSQEDFILSDFLFVPE